MNRDQVLGIARHILTFGGGFLASAGVVASSDVELGVGALVTLIGIVWSAFQKKGLAP